MHAEILSWSRSRGLFAGLSLEGSTLRPDGSEDAKLYGEKVTNEQILHGELRIPNGARPLVAELNRYRMEQNPDVGASLRDKGRVTLSNVHFATGKADITSDSETALNGAVNALKKHSDWNIRVEGFTDNVGSKEANLKLSSDRAEAVMNWLVAHGIDRARLSAKGYGESRPVASNSTEGGRAKNRRVELVRT
jgi:outer membrane protein OmpA-like peptidoglycan-associated protein